MANVIPSYQLRTANQSTAFRRPFTFNTTYFPHPSQMDSSSSVQMGRKSAYHKPNAPQHVPFAMTEPTLQWPVNSDMPNFTQRCPNYQISPFYTADSTDLLAYPVSSNEGHGLPYYNTYQFTYSTAGHDLSCPRSYYGIGLVDSMGDLNESYPPTVYQLEPMKPSTFNEFSDGITADTNNSLKHNDDFSLYGSSQDKKLRKGPSNISISCAQTHCNRPTEYQDDQCTVSDNSKRGPVMDDNNADKEQPYAQLIFRALMDAPGHTMILRDIYNWFRVNTDKAIGETKGWQNSIRHNLSMNGAFEKVDQPPGDSDARKGFMWRLTEEAIREGVKSTTRYRSKALGKRGNRAQHSVLQKQALNSKNNHTIRKSARLRNAERFLTTSGPPQFFQSDSFYDQEIRRSNVSDTEYKNHQCSMVYPSPCYLSNGVEAFTEETVVKASKAPLPSTTAPVYFPSPEEARETTFMFTSSTQDPLFYDSPDSGSADEPPTPDTFSMDADPYKDTDIVM